MDTSKYIGKCIYCGSVEDLSDEHIIPYGLAGNLTLTKASCKKHRDITSIFEGEVLRKQFILVRSTQNYPTRHKSRRPKYFEFAVNKETKKIPVQDCPAMFMMLGFLQPRCISNYGYDKGIYATGYSTHEANFQEFREKYDVQNFSYSQDLGSNFARLVAKIAYCAAVYKYGLDSFAEVNILPSIIGDKDDIGYWVGCPTDYKREADVPPKESCLHKIVIFEKNKQIAVTVRLFASFQTPEYLAIVGKLKGKAE